MKQAKLIEALQLLQATVPNTQVRPGWTVASCPLAPWTHDGGTDKNPAFAVRSQYGDPFTNCFACGWHGPLSSLVIEMRHRNKASHAVDVPWGKVLDLIEDATLNDYMNLDTPDTEELLFGEKKGMHEFASWWFDSFPKWRDVSFAVDYVAERKISPAVADFLDLRADTDQRRVCFPVRDFDGVLRGLHGRAVDPDIDPRYRMYLQAKRNNPIVWLGEHWIDLSKPIVVVEGPVDLASVYRVYRNVTSPLFANPSLDKIKRMSDALEWITFLDRGKGGDAGRLKIASALHKDHVITHVQPPKGSKDPGAMNIPELRDALSPYVKLDPEM